MNTPRKTGSGLARFTSLFYRNWISLAGFVLAVAAAFAFVFLFGIDLFAHGGNPYMGILAYLVAPGFFFGGVGLIVRVHKRAGGCFDLTFEALVTS